MQQASAPLSEELRNAQLEIDRWRASNGGRRRIPESFWRRAAQLGQTHSVNSVAQAMRLSHERIKQHLESSSATNGVRQTAHFVELTALKSSPSPVGGHGLTLQLRDGGGRRMQVVGADAHSAAQVVCAFFGEVSA